MGMQAIMYHHNCDVGLSPDELRSADTADASATMLLASGSGRHSKSTKSAETTTGISISSYILRLVNTGTVCRRVAGSIKPLLTHGSLYQTNATMIESVYI